MATALQTPSMSTISESGFRYKTVFYNLHSRCLLLLHLGVFIYALRSSQPCIRRYFHSCCWPALTTFKQLLWFIEEKINEQARGSVVWASLSDMRCAERSKFKPRLDDNCLSFYYITSYFIISLHYSVHLLSPYWPLVQEGWQKNVKNKDE